jgi:ferredoxin
MKEKKLRLRNDKDKLKKLIMLMNKQNKRPFPPIDAMLQTIDYVITGEELDVLLKLGTDTYSYELAAATADMDIDTFIVIFESLKQKGFIGIRYSDIGEERYSLNALLVGWFEAQVSYLIGKPEEKEFSRRWFEFMNSMKNYNFFPIRNLMNIMTRNRHISNQSVGVVHAHKNEKGKSIINIDETITVGGSKIYPTKSVNDLIREYGDKSVIGQFNCMCRRVMSNVDDPCRLAMPDDGGCLALGELAKYYIQCGHARQISKEQAFEVIQKTRDKGAVHSVFHEQDDSNLPQIGICNCCWDCCGILRSYNSGAMPLRYSSFYMAKITDDAKCIGCKKCEKYCPTAAIMVTDKKASINTKKCIGCGQCVHQCANSAVELEENVRTVFLPMLKKSEARITV